MAPKADLANSLRGRVSARMARPASLVEKPLAATGSSFPIESCDVINLERTERISQLARAPHCRFASSRFLPVNRR